MAGVVSDKVLPQHSKRKVYHSSELLEPPKGSSTIASMLSKRKVYHSSELLEPPKGSSTIASMLKELEGKQKKAPAATDKPPKMFRIETSSVLSRVRRFIPKMELSEQGQNMELVGEDGPCIEIDMAVIPMSGGDSEVESSSDYSSSESEDEENKNCSSPLVVELKR